MQVVDKASGSMVTEVTAAIDVVEQAGLTERAVRFAHLVNER
jgi:hypothetical protein